MRNRLVKIFQKSSRNCIEAPMWSGSPISYILIDTCVSQAINPVNKPTAKQLEEFSSIIENAFGPIKQAEPKPISCSPISPSKLPPRTLPYPSIESLGILYAIKEAPPKMAAVRPRQVGIMEGFTADAKAKRGVAPKPRPITPIPQRADLMKLFLDTIISIFSLSLSFSVTDKYSGFMYDEPIIPTSPPINPKRDSFVRAAAVKPRDSVTQEVPRAPTSARPVVLQTFCMKRLSPTFLEMQWLVVSCYSLAEGVKGLGLLLAKVKSEGDRAAVGLKSLSAWAAVFEIILVSKRLQL